MAASMGSKVWLLSVTRSEATKARLKLFVENSLLTANALHLRILSTTARWLSWTWLIILAYISSNPFGNDRKHSSTSTACLSRSSLTAKLIQRSVPSHFFLSVLSIEFNSVAGKRSWPNLARSSIDDQMYNSSPALISSFESGSRRTLNELPKSLFRHSGC